MIPTSVVNRHPQLAKLSKLQSIPQNQNKFQNKKFLWFNINLYNKFIDIYV
jgi:hypothetical protein